MNSVFNMSYRRKTNKKKFHGDYLGKKYNRNVGMVALETLTIITGPSANAFF